MIKSVCFCRIVSTLCVVVRDVLGQLLHVKCLLDCSHCSNDKKKESKDVRSRLAVIRMLFVVWLVFIVCWLPFLCFVLIDIYAEDWLMRQIDTNQFNYIYPSLHIATMANSCLNPLLYAFMSR